MRADDLGGDLRPERQLEASDLLAALRVHRVLRHAVAGYRGATPARGEIDVRNDAPAGRVVDLRVPGSDPQHAGDHRRHAIVAAQRHESHRVDRLRVKRRQGGMLDDALLHNPAVGRLVEPGDELIERELVPSARWRRPCAAS